MNDTAALWQQANQRYLSAALAVVRVRLESHASSGVASKGGHDATTLSQAQAALKLAQEALSHPSALETVCAAFGLSPFERELLLLCAGMELEGRFRAICASAQDDPSLQYPTFSLAMAAFPDPHWGAIAPNAPLRRWKLIEVQSADSPVTGPLHIDESVLHYLVGLPYYDERVECLVEPLGPTEDFPSAYSKIAQEIEANWIDKRPEGNFPIVQLCGSEGATRRAIAANAYAKLGLRTYCLPAETIPANAMEREQLARLWERSAILDPKVLFIDAEELDDPRSALDWFLDNVRAPIAVGSRDRLTTLSRPVVWIDVKPISSLDQLDLLKRSLGALAAKLNGTLESVVSEFNLTTGAIREISATVLNRTPEQPDSETRQILWDACRVYSRSHADNFAHRMEPRAAWADLVLPEPQERSLREIAANVRRRFTVHETWGFARKSSRGLSITALFSGASGTGKTMAAEVLAHELRLDLLRIDLSRVVSKYIGETEKNLRRVFDVAEHGGAILFFDEADALFGKRSEVKDSHDRYANIEISYLLQRMEEYSGLAILATNMKDALDSAFLRRIRFVVYFPFPDASQRAEIWRRVFPTETPVDKLDFARLATLSIAGGNIRNVALHAAFLAADAGQPVRMQHIAHAAESEFAKMGRSLSPSEIEGWA